MDNGIREYTVSLGITGIRAKSPEEAARKAAAMVPDLVQDGIVAPDATVTWSPGHMMFDAVEVVTLDFSNLQEPDSIPMWPADSAGCIVDSHHGIYAMKILAELAITNGWRPSPEDHQIISDSPHGSKEEEMVDIADEALGWLNANVCPEDMHIDWLDGNVYFMPFTWWADV